MFFFLNNEAEKFKKMEEELSENKDKELNWLIIWHFSKQIKKLGTRDMDIPNL